MMLALGLTALGAVLVLATSGQARWTSGGADLRGGAAPAATAFALVALAGIGLLLLVGGRVRTVLGPSLPTSPCRCPRCSRHRSDRRCTPPTRCGSGSLPSAGSSSPPADSS